MTPLFFNATPIAAPVKKAPVKKAVSPKPVARVASPPRVTKGMTLTKTEEDIPAPAPPAEKPAAKKRGPTGPRPKRDTVQVSKSAKGTVRERCERQTLKKYTNRNSPPYPASACCVEKQFIHKGNDGGLYYAKQAADGSCRWQKCKPVYPGCPAK